MQIALIADTFPPLRTSGAVQLRDLSREFQNQGHHITALIPSSDIKQPWVLEEIDQVRVLRLRAPKTKEISYIRRTIAESLMPYFMMRNLRKSPLANEKWDGVVWYSPSIFHGPLVKAIKKSSLCKSYLIVRDVFPQWAADMGLMSRNGLVYRFFDAIARYQYSLADTIGVQTTGNLTYFQAWSGGLRRQLEVLQNWVFDAPVGPCSISLANTKLAGRKIFVYAGNMGVAQGVDRFLDLAELMQEQSDVGFLFVGRGSEALRLADDAKKRGLCNVLFCDEIHPDEIPGLYAQCAVGLVALDPKHKSHNIPGKFLTYMQSKLPVLAVVNAGNDLISIIEENKIGRATSNENQEYLAGQALAVLELIAHDNQVRNRCRALYEKLFSPQMAVKQIVSALNR